MAKVKAIIIENEFDIPKELEWFLEDNKKLFKSVDKQIACLHRPFNDIARFIVKADAVIASSTWTYKDQLETFVAAFAVQKLGKPYKFYIHPGFCDQLNYWNEKSETGRYKSYCYFNDCDGFVANLKKLIQEQEVYDIVTNYEGKVKEGRLPWIPKRIAYDKKKDLFYHV